MEKILATTSFDLSQRSHHSVTSFNFRPAEQDMKVISGVKREVCGDAHVAETRVTSFSRFWNLRSNVASDIPHFRDAPFVNQS